MSIQYLDIQLLLFVNRSLANPAFDVLMPALSLRGYLLVIPFLLALFLKGVYRKGEQEKTFLATVRIFLVACVAVYLSGLVEDWMKDAVARVRPCRSMAELRLIFPCPKSYSMPSGHAISSFSFALSLFYLTREHIALIWRLYPLLLASLIAFSRVYVGVHYPSDVLAGALMGSVIGLVLSRLYEMIGTEDRGKWKRGS
jgi:undecaprenyl-diphosphatase